MRPSCIGEPITNSSPASSYARASSSSTRSREARGDLPHPVRVDTDSGVLHRREHRRERELDLVVEPLEAALANPLAQERRQPKGCFRVPDEGRGLLLRCRLRLQLEPVLRSKVAQQVLGAAGVDEIGRDQRVVGSFDAERLRVVHGEQGVTL